MKRWIIILLVLATAAAVRFAALELSRGHGHFVVSDVTRPMERAIRAPVVLFRNGALFVTVDGQLDGDATLLILSNHGRDRRNEVLSGTMQGRTIGGAEEWVDDLVVRFEPGSARRGQVRIQMACGKNPKRIK